MPERCFDRFEVFHSECTGGEQLHNISACRMSCRDFRRRHCARNRNQPASLCFLDYIAVTVRRNNIFRSRLCCNAELFKRQHRARADSQYSAESANKFIQCFARNFGCKILFECNFNGFDSAACSRINGAKQSVAVIAAGYCNDAVFKYFFKRVV